VVIGAEIIIEDGCNVGENCTFTCSQSTTVLLKKKTHVDGAIVHGATLKRKEHMISMNAVVMDNT
jgi:carbonic anhydrase/acetyltransferase-like protein (isoleucine patch superfamily)